MEKTIELNAGALDAAASALQGQGPIYMINLLRYREQADYGDLEMPPCTGREAYQQRYVAAFAKAAGSKEFTVFYIGAVHATLVAPAGEAWDDVAIVEYPSFEVLRSIVDSAAYENEAALHHRAALSDWRFIATTKRELPA